MDLAWWLDGRHREHGAGLAALRSELEQLCARYWPPADGPAPGRGGAEHA